MRSRKVIRLVLSCCLLAVCVFTGRAQRPNIAVLDEKAQKQFLEEYLALYVKDVELIDSGLNDDAVLLIRTNSWAVDMVVEKIKAIRKEADDDWFRVSALVDKLYDSGRRDVLDILNERLRDEPQYPDLVRRVLVHSISEPNPDSFSVWSRALESENPVVKAAMRKLLAGLWRYPHGRQWNMIVAGIVNRYGHSPTAVEMASDPFFVAIQEGDPGRAGQIKSLLLSSTEKEHLRRQLAPSVVRK